LGCATGGSKLIDPLYTHRGMARRKSKARTLQPAVMKMNFVVPQGTQTSYISISHSVSRLNRRFYRQGLNWAVANVTVTQLPAAATGSGSTAYVNTIPHTWSVANAWMKSFSLWKKQQDEALENSDSIETAARFRDFKISMEDGHTVGTDLSPVSIGPGRTFGPFQTGLLAGQQIDPSEEWMSSEIVVPNDGAPGNVNQYNLHMVGVDVPTSKGMIQGYADSRDVPQSPDPAGPLVSASWMQEMFDVGNDNLLVANNAQDRNNELPYDQDAYPGGSTNFIELECQGYSLNRSTIGLNTFKTGPFTAPCGLIRLDFLDDTIIEGSTNQNVITVELVPGNHRGYLAETMEEF